MRFLGVSVLIALAIIVSGPAKTEPSWPADTLALPKVGDHLLRAITPTVLELTAIATEPPGGKLSLWDFAGHSGHPNLPAPGLFRVRSGGSLLPVLSVGFKRRVLYAPLKHRDLRIGCALYLILRQPIRPGALVDVSTPGSALWPAAWQFTTRLDANRWSPAIHANQVGYMPDLPKLAFIGYYLGSLGELRAPQSSSFTLASYRSGKVVFQGKLEPRRDQGFPYAVQPYQHVLQADFSAFRIPGEYRLKVEGLGVSLPFRIDFGVAAAFARTYALGIYHQRCGAAEQLPFTRFVHGPCHTAPAEVPTMAFTQVQQELARASANFRDNPRHTAPQLKDVASSLYPFVRTGLVDVSGGHHDAGDYSKYTINSAQFISTMVFAADAFPGVGDLDNLGIPESGDGKSDVLQMAKWEADFLLKLQDSDGGFYFLVYPRSREYENDVLPDHGDPQVVFPKTTAATAAATAALAQTASSPRFAREFPEAANRYLGAARKGWAFLERAWPRYGMDGSYQKITHYGDTFMHDDEIAWAATELYLATGERRFQARLLAEFDPSNPATLRWGWERMFEAYGCAIRSYAFAAVTGRVSPDKLNPVFLAKCRKQILACGEDQVRRAEASAYGTSFPLETKQVRAAGWYFSMEQAFDLAVADQLAPRPEFTAAIVSNMNYEAGGNPNNVTLLTGLGWKRQREIVSQYHLNDRRVLPPSGIPIGNIQDGFMSLEPYRGELNALTFPSDSDRDNPYPFYDRWADSFNVSTECVTAIQARGFAAMAVLMARSPIARQPWRAANATILGVGRRMAAGRPFTVSLRAKGLDLSRALIVWEGDNQEPSIGPSRTFGSPRPGHQWVEAEAQLPDGRRAFAAFEYDTGQQSAAAH